MVAFATNPTTHTGAFRLDSQQRQQVAVEALTGGCVSGLAQQHQVSRKFIYQQKERAQQALNESFTQSSSDEVVLYYIPVTKKWLHGLVLITTA